VTVGSDVGEAIEDAAVGDPAHLETDLVVAVDPPESIMGFINVVDVTSPILVSGSQFPPRPTRSTTGPRRHAVLDSTDISNVFEVHYDP
jgi:hypothetical protein